MHREKSAKIPSEKIQERKSNMKNDNTEQIRTRILGLIESEFESDAAFERAMGLSDKTVNNWRRARSASFMKMLPRISNEFGVNIGELLNMPLRRDTSELSEEELHILKLYRKSRSMPEPMRNSLRQTLETTINLYISSYSEMKNTAKRRGPKKKDD